MMNIKKKKTSNIIMMLCCAMLQDCLANIQFVADDKSLSINSNFSKNILIKHTRLHELEELLKFCNYNGHKYVAILDLSVTHFKPYLLFFNSDYNIQSHIFTNKDNLMTSINSNLDLLIIKKDQNIEFQEVLSIFGTRKPQKSILVIHDNEIEDFMKSLREFGANSYFYMLKISLQHHLPTFQWYTIMTFNHDSQFIMNKITFNEMGNVIANYDMNGYRIVAAALTWKPALAVEDCDQNGRNCKSYGIIADLLNSMAREYNFTWDIYKDLDNDWGLFPVEGPFNASGVWKGTMGDVLTGKYPIGINGWIRNPTRARVLEFVPIIKTAAILCYIPTAPEVDPGLFIRPFTNDVWHAIAIILSIGLTTFISPYFFVKGWGTMKANSIIEVSLWCFFVLINAYYGGALTMFFVSEITVPFNTLRDVLQVFPEWNLIFPTGADIVFKLPAFQGDPDYVKYWNAVESEGGYEKHVVANVKEGFKELKNGQTVLFGWTDILRAAYYEDPKSIQGIKTFGLSKSEYFNFIFPKKSPLIPLFTHATTKLFERGQSIRTDFKWQGNKIKSEGAVDVLILTSGQVFLIYAILGFFLGLSIILLSMEYCHKKCRPFMSEKTKTIQKRLCIKI